MSRHVGGVLAIALVAVLIGCNRADQQKTHEKTEEAKRKARAGAERLRQEAHKLGEQAKQGASSLGQNIDQALHSTRPAQGDATSGAEEKLRNGGRDLRAAGGQAAVKLDRAAMIAKIKAKLAADVGMSTITSVDVDASGQVVTLRGTVSSEQQKQQAEQAVLQVSGAARVVNELSVKP